MSDNRDLQMLQAQPLVSIIIPTYNYGHFISETLDSITKQTHKNWECIIVDDGSTDNTKQIIESKYLSDPRIKYIYQDNKHQAAAKNNGIKNSKGKYLQFLDADDLLESEKLEFQVDFLEKTEHVDITYNNARYFTTEEPDARWFFMKPDDTAWIPEVSGKGHNIITAIINENIMPINSPLLRRSVIDDVGLFDESLQLIEDWDFWIRCALKEKYIQYKNWNNSLALIRSHTSSFSRNRLQVNISTLIMRSKIDALIKAPDIKALNHQLYLELEEWIKKIKLTIEDLENLIGYTETFLLVDEDQIKGDLVDFNSIPFIEIDEEYGGRPADSGAAIAEFNRQKDKGTSFIVFVWMAFWWLEYYEEWHKYLRSNFTCVLENERAIIFKLKTYENS